MLDPLPSARQGASMLYRGMVRPVVLWISMGDSVMHGPSSAHPARVCGGFAGVHASRRVCGGYGLACACVPAGGRTGEFPRDYY
jgi:hypothetical protein